MQQMNGSAAEFAGHEDYFKLVKKHRATTQRTVLRVELSDLDELDLSLASDEGADPYNRSPLL